MAKIEIYKKSQGKYTRLTTFIAAVLTGGLGAVVLGRQLAASFSTAATYIEFGVPLVLTGGLAVLMFWLVNRPKSADFLIATEGEMKKVSWSSRKEVIGSTKVVIVTSVILSMILLGVDVLFIKFFGLIGVM
ncbi:MAG: preprotein translocase subunit SecE [Phycisphaerae bacterium]